MNAKISLFFICVEGIIHSLLHNLHDCTSQISRPYKVTNGTHTMPLPWVNNTVGIAKSTNFLSSAWYIYSWYVLIFHESWSLILFVRHICLLFNNLWREKLFWIDRVELWLLFFHCVSTNPCRNPTGEYTKKYVQTKFLKR